MRWRKPLLFRTRDIMWLGGVMQRACRAIITSASAIHCRQGSHMPCFSPPNERSEWRRYCFRPCLSVFLYVSVRSGPANQTSLKRLKLRTLNMTRMFPGTGRRRSSSLLADLPTVCGNWGTKIVGKWEPHVAVVDVALQMTSEMTSESACSLKRRDRSPFGFCSHNRRERRERTFISSQNQTTHAISVIATSFVTGHQKRQTAHQCLATQIKTKKLQSCTTLKKEEKKDNLTSHRLESIRQTDQYYTSA